MTVPTRLESIERALRNAPAHELPGVLEAVLGHHFGVAGLEIYLVDLRLAVLEPVLEPEGPGIPLVATVEGRVFCDQVHVQQPLDQEVALHLPMTVRGDRLGVLWLRLPDAPDDAMREELAEAAELAAHAIILAEVATDRYRRARRPQRLTLAAEMQWQLLPVRSVECAAYRLAGQLEPAYAVRGDNFDWAQDVDSLTVAVTNGMGESITAAMLTTLAITALRNARRSGANLATQAVLANDAPNSTAATPPATPPTASTVLQYCKAYLLMLVTVGSHIAGQGLRATSFAVRKHRDLEAKAAALIRSSSHLSHGIVAFQGTLHTSRP
ncbi:hypothetical protein [Saccharopolyspora elongata]|uniref:Uncharacterized protein n=1 Tax=Saccharopolyspora elongata TaxID=2530387 RepID=A0A4R4YA40_9PSEU|nr:hypothetical protein [Saccharopolyspora elongata]TDD41276.1 hypothetical protein E1288_33240 [Saccharopolyspora elongata]